ncbi:hypothetical protein D9M69_584830 [compost metagenome]
MEFSRLPADRAPKAPMPATPISGVPDSEVSLQAVPLSLARPPALAKLASTTWPCSRRWPLL